MPYKINLRSAKSTVKGKIASIKSLIVDATLSIAGAAADAKVVGDALEEILTDGLNPHLQDTNNPHNVTKELLGLGKVDNTSDADKPVSAAQEKAIATAKQAGTDAMAEAKKRVIKTNAVVTLTASGWSGTQQTVKVTKVTADNSVVVGAAPESYLAYAESNVRCTAQAKGSLTFTCEDAPESDLTVNIMILD